MVQSILAPMLRGAAAEVKANHDELSRLDSVGGDGDHGTTMVRAMTCMEKALDAATDADMQVLLNDVGWAIMGVDGGATGPLFGTFFMGMADGAAGAGAGATLDAAGLAAMFEAGLAKVCKQTKAQVGDKTMIDSLTPAVIAMKAASMQGAALPDALKDAAEAAQQGAESTKALQARFGRARNIKEQSIGTQDPGATSVAYMFRGFWKGAQAHA